jgi:adenosine deaminase
VNDLIAVPTNLSSRHAMDQQTQQYHWIRYGLPKVELHVHLNGCIPIHLLQELAKERSVTLPARYFGSHDATADHKDRPDVSNLECKNGIDSSLPLLSPPPDLYNIRPRSLQDCFDMFAVLPSVVNDLVAVRTITRHCLHYYFANHAVAYVEIRSTPKRLMFDCKNNALVATKRDYVTTIVQVMHEFEVQEKARYEAEQDAWQKMRQQTLLSAPYTNPSSPEASTRSIPLPPRLPLTCRLILALDRSQSLSEAADTVQLAIQLRQEADNESQHGALCSKYIVGMDLGGNPTRQSFADFAPLLHQARQAGLHITVHCGEVSSLDNDRLVASSTTTTTTYQEALDVLQFGPDRLGHAVLWPHDLRPRLDALQIPIETCPTSNIMTLELHQQHEHTSDNCESHGNMDESAATGPLQSPPSRRNGDLIHGLGRHGHLAHWIQTRYPLVVCTDDPGVFDTNPTQELWLLYQTHAEALQFKDLSDMVIRSMSYAFCDEETKRQVQDSMRHYIDLARQSGIWKMSGS